MADTPLSSTTGAAIDANAPRSIQTESSLENLTRLASRIASASVGLLSHAEDERDVFVYTLDANGAARLNQEVFQSFCALVAEQRLPLIVGDTTAHTVTSDNETIRRASIASYIGFPLFIDGRPHGSLCVVDTDSREWTLAELEAMQDFAALATTKLSLRYDKEARTAREKSLYDLLEHATDMIMRVSLDDGKILFANKAVRESLGYTTEELLGRVALDLVAPEFREAYVAAGARVAQRGEVPDFSAELITKNGTRLIVRGSANCQYEDGRPVSARLIFKDITVKQRLKDELTLIEDVAHSIRNGSDLAGAFVEVLDKLCVFTGWDRGEAWTAEDSDSPQFLASWTRPDIDTRFLPTTPRSAGSEGDAIFDLAKHRRRFFTDESETSHAGTIAVFPLMSGEDCIGALAFYSTRRIGLLEQRRGVLSAAANQIGPILGRRMTEESLRASEARYRHFIETAQEGVWAFTIDGKTDYVNRRMAGILGYEPEAMAGKSILDFVHHESRQHLLEQFEHCQKGERTSREHRFVTSTGDDCWALVATSPIVDPLGRFNGILALVTDISKRKSAETQLRMRERQLSEAQKVARMGSWDWDLETGLITASDELYRVLEIEREEPFTYEIFLNHVEPADVNRLKAEMLDAVEKQTPLSTEYSVVSADGTVRTISARGDFYYDPSGMRGHMAGVVKDITQAKIAEMELRRAAQIVDLANDAVLMRRVDGTITFWSHGAEQVYGWSRSEAMGRNADELLHTDKTTLAANERVLKSGRWAGELEQANKDGKKLRVDARWSVIQDMNSVPSVLEINTDVTERHRVEELFGAVLAASTEYAIIGADLSGVIHTFNPGAEKLLGYTAAEIIGKTSPEIFHDAEEVAQRARELHIKPGFEVFVANVRGGASETRDWTYIRKDRKRVPVSLTVSEMCDSRGVTTGYIGVAVDITTRLAAEKASIAAREAAEQGARAKSEFLANMSHEIRTPINGITGMTELLLDTSLSQEQREYLELVQVSAKSLIGIIDDVLDFSRIDAGKLALENQPFELRHSIHETMRTLEFRARQKGLRLVYEVHAEVPDRLIGDLGRVRQVIVNLVENAIKFTSEGEIRVDVSAEEENADAVTLRFVVVDTGIGIPADRRTQIFDPFTQADASTTRRYGGSGLGLSISKQLVELMDGRIWVESEIGEGSSFFFTAKFERDKTPKEARRRKRITPRSQVASRGRPLRILVAEDNPVNQRLAVAILEKHGHSSVLASTGEEALRLAQADEFDAILMDVQMPELGGLEATRMIRMIEEKTGQHIPIIGVTAHAMPEDAKRCIDSGMDAYCAKPIRGSELLAKLEELAYADKGPAADLSEHSTKEETPAKSSAHEAAPKVSLTLSARRKKMLDAVGGDEDLLVELAQIFLDDSRYVLDDLRQAIELGDAQGVIRHAHKFRGSVATFDADDLTGMALSIEQLCREGSVAATSAIFDELMQVYKEFAELLSGVIASVSPVA